MFTATPTNTVAQPPPSPPSSPSPSLSTPTPQPASNTTTTTSTTSTTTPTTPAPATTLWSNTSLHDLYRTRPNWTPWEPPATASPYVRSVAAKLLTPPTPSSPTSPFPSPSTPTPTTTGHLDICTITPADSRALHSAQHLPLTSGFWLLPPLRAPPHTTIRLFLPGPGRCEAAGTVIVIPEHAVGYPAAKGAMVLVRGGVAYGVGVLRTEVFDRHVDEGRGCCGADFVVVRGTVVGGGDGDGEGGVGEGDAVDVDAGGDAGEVPAPPPVVGPADLLRTIAALSKKTATAAAVKSANAKGVGPPALRSSSSSSSSGGSSTGSRSSASSVASGDKGKKPSAPSQARGAPAAARQAGTPSSTTTTTGTGSTATKQARGKSGGPVR
ncbi:hypothetical protein DFJ73DRAFT_346429 [Zopfochytrium polystomum]|nr:hypothetical protein DFJ73DRAFT_346429 [Zopfochytrium polystomum]